MKLQKTMVTDRLNFGDRRRNIFKNIHHHNLLC